MFSPERVAAFGIGVYLTVWLVAPVQVVFPVSWGAFGYIAACYAAFWIGCLLLRGGSLGVAAVQDPRLTRNAFLLTAALGALGIALKVYDKLFIRGTTLAESALEARELLVEAQAGPVAALGGLLYPFCYVPLILWWAKSKSSPLGAKAKWIAVLLYILPAVDALLLLSRSQMLVALSMMYFAASCVLFGGRLLHRRLVMPVVAGAAILIFLSVVVFSARLTQMDAEILFSILYSAYGYVLAPTPLTLALMSGDSEGIASLVTAVIPFFQYYLHGLFEFGLLWDRPDTQILTYGTQHFAPYVKALSIFDVITYPDFATDNVYYRNGVFTSFFGPLWIDFGWLGTLFMLIFGAFCKSCANLARGGTLAVIPLYSFLCVVLFFMPVVNLIVSAQGMYILNALLIVWLLLPRASKRRMLAPA